MKKMQMCAGVSLLELLLTMSVIAILVAVSLPLFSTSTQSIKQTRAQTAYREFASEVRTLLKRVPQPGQTVELTAGGISCGGHQLTWNQEALILKRPGRAVIGTPVPPKATLAVTQSHPGYLEAIVTWPSSFRDEKTPHSLRILVATGGPS